MSDALLLEARGLTKRYGDVSVLRNVSLDVRAGEIHGLLGANGAGKSTLCRIVSGLISATEGSMQLAGVDFDPRNKQQAETAGVEIVQQELNLIETLSVAENLFLTRLPRIGGIVRSRRLHEESRAVLDRFGLTDIRTDAPVELLGIGHQQMVEIATALARQCRLLIMDEPTAALSASESEHLFAHLRTLREQGVGIIYISHRLNEVSALTDRVSILRDGQFVATHATESLTTDDMVDLMSGESHTGQVVTHTSHRHEEVAMSVRSLRSGIVQDVSFDVRRGERLGLTGLVGSGRTELLRAVFGADVATSGKVSLFGESDRRCFRHPVEAVAAGLAMVTEDRKQNGLLLSQSITHNSTLSSVQKRFSRFGLVDSRSECRAAQQWTNDLETRCESIDQSVETLSGGNQQKVVVAKWLVCDAEVFLFDEPTRGIDVAARRRIYRLLESLAAEGKACVIVSSDLEELFETCDAIAVMSDGKLVRTYQRDEWSYDQIMQDSFSGFVK